MFSIGVAEGLSLGLGGLRVGLAPDVIQPVPDLLSTRR